MRFALWASFRQVVFGLGLDLQVDGPIGFNSLSFLVGPVFIEVYAGCTGPGVAICWFGKLLGAWGRA